MSRQCCGFLARREVQVGPKASQSWSRRCAYLKDCVFVNSPSSPPSVAPSRGYSSWIVRVPGSLNPRDPADDEFTFDLSSCLLLAATQGEGGGAIARAIVQNSTDVAH